MSDYLFTTQPGIAADLTDRIHSIYTPDRAPETVEFSGNWGSLSAGIGHYCGFRPYETEHHILVVIGGPVLYFRDNSFLTKSDSDEATRAIYTRWVEQDAMVWDEDLSGPFTLLLVDKLQGSVAVATDLMAFIPIYACHTSDTLALGTHIDALAEACGQAGEYDQVSLADFVANNIITYPYTAYTAIRQLAPGSVTRWNAGEQTCETYWQPTECNPYANINEAAEYLRDGIQGYVDRITQDMGEVAQFISGGEDSRALSGVLPPRLKRDAYIFLDNMNREGRIAQKVAAAYGAKFTCGTREATHYADIMPETCRLVGTGHQYMHAHSYGFDKTCSLTGYRAVFGGYLADSLLKSPYSRKVRGASRFKFLPDLIYSNTDKRDLDTQVFSEVTNAMEQRVAERYQVLSRLRHRSVYEWHVLYPSSMRMAIGNFYSTRRLFTSYEPFMCNAVVKIAAAAPYAWKLNRRLFHKAMKPYLKPSKWLFHADGRLPYFSWVVNIAPQFTIWFYRQVGKRTGFIKGNQGPWNDWNAVFASDVWQQQIQASQTIRHQLQFQGQGKTPDELMQADEISKTQYRNMVQLLTNLRVNVELNPKYSMDRSVNVSMERAL